MGRRSQPLTKSTTISAMSVATRPVGGRDRVSGSPRRHRSVSSPNATGRHDPGPTGGVQADLEDPAGTIRAGQTGPHLDQHRVHEPGIVEVQPATGVLPAGIGLERLHRLPIRQAMESLNTIITATIRGGTDRRPRVSNRSANISSGKNT